MDKTEIFKVFSSSTRVKIFEILLEGRICVSGIVKELNVSQPTVTQHLRILKQLGLVSSEKIGYWMHYCVNETGLKKVKDEIGDYIKKLSVKKTKCKISPFECPKKTAAKK